MKNNATSSKPNKADHRRSKRLIFQGEIIVLLPVPATVQWTLWLQRVAAALSSRDEGEPTTEDHADKLEEQGRVRVRVRRRPKHRNRALDEQLLDADELEELNRRLQEQLLALSPPAFERLLMRVLERLGYADLHRLHNGEANGRALRGMAHLRGTIGKGAGSLTVLVTAKRYAYPVSRRFVDELRGAMLRHNAQAGLLITTSTFPPAARRAVQEDAHLPVMLMDEARLRRALISHSVGVEQLADGRTVLDLSFFADLEAQAHSVR